MKTRGGAALSSELCESRVDMAVSQNYGYLLRSSNSRDYNTLGSILGSPYFGKLPHQAWNDSQSRDSRSSALNPKP